MDIEAQYQSYLSKLRMDESLMPKAQRQENRNAFVAGATVVLGGLLECERKGVDPNIFVQTTLKSITDYYKCVVMDSADRIIDKSFRDNEY